MWEGDEEDVNPSRSQRVFDFDDCWVVVVVLGVAFGAGGADEVVVEAKSSKSQSVFVFVVFVVGGFERAEGVNETFVAVEEEENSSKSQSVSVVFFIG